MPSKPGVVTMSRADFLREHKHLIKLLKTGDAFVKEAKAQSREVKQKKRYF